MKKLLFVLLIACGFVSRAQVYNNEWIDYSKTYYKFTLLNTGFYRIPKSALDAAGIGNVPAENFQLWRNGKQIPIYTSTSSGVLSPTDYLEFYGLYLDGKPDKELYRDPSYQLSDHVSLETDSSTYFLTVNASGNNLRLSSTPNNVSANTLPAEQYFMHTIGYYPTDQLSQGFAVNVVQNLYSSSYDMGEGWAGPNIGMNGSSTNSFAGLNAFNGGPAPKLKIALSGNALNTRRYKVAINGDSVAGKELDYYNILVDSASFSLSSLSSGTAAVTVTNNTFCSVIGCPSGDAMVVHQFEITYPRQFNFGGANLFEFTLPASSLGNFLQISNFNYGTSGAVPVLYDLSNGRRYVADMSAAPLLQFALPPTSAEQHLILGSEDPSVVRSINSLTPRAFTDFSKAVNQGDYLIISNQLLATGSHGNNPVEDYRAYRSSSAGGAYNAKTFWVDQLIDQFGFGIDGNPAAIRNFIRFARNKFSVTPRQVFLLGRGVNYVEHRYNYTNVYTPKLNLVPTFGYPASDVLLSAEPGSSAPSTPIGRLSAITGKEIETYLSKVQEYEAAQETGSPAFQDKAWMKNVVHIVGADDPALSASLKGFLDGYKTIIEDTLYGAYVSTFTKNTADPVTQLTSDDLSNLFQSGISIISYFGHSGTTVLNYNLSSPMNYNNAGKYPMFFALGCEAGDIFSLSTNRLQAQQSLSEAFDFAPEKGTIGFVASTSWGIPYYLDIWSTNAYNRIAHTNYGKSIGEIMKGTAEDVFAQRSQEDFYARCNVEEIVLNGDPAITLNAHAKADYVVEDPFISISPSFISVGDQNFKVKAKFYNLGKAVDKKIVVEVKRTYPNQKVVVVQRDTIPGIRYADSISLNIPINPLTDQGPNKITVTVDADNAVDELYENNNSVTKDVMIYADAAHPIYPYNYAIVGKQNIKFQASTSDPFSKNKQYRMEIDTTELFNSSRKVTATVMSTGGAIEFDPPITFLDSTVYYWRVARDTTTNLRWNEASFIYIANKDEGFNQSHYYQHLHSDTKGIQLDGSRTWQFDSVTNNLFIKNGVYFTATTMASDLSLAVNGSAYIASGCVGYSLLFNVIDPKSFQPWLNTTGRYGSAMSCGTSRNWNFEYSYMTAASRKRAMDFMDSIPVGSIVVVRNLLNNYQPSGFVKDWMADTALYGSNNSLYHKLKALGFATLDSFTSPKAFGFVYWKGVAGFTPVYTMSQGQYDITRISVDIRTPGVLGAIKSAQFGPMKSWKMLEWSGQSLETPVTDNASIDVVGVKIDGTADTLMHDISPDRQSVDISTISAAVYPYIQLYMHNVDSTNATPYQLNYWRVTGTPVPEGAVAPNLLYQMNDTADIAEPINFQMAFKNVSDVPFDSVRVKMTITDKNNIQHPLPGLKLKPIVSGDTANIRFSIDTRQLAGSNTLKLDVNPDNDQPEQYHPNNVVYRNFYVRPDTLHPVMDVTFDNVHILNNDVVSSKPTISIKLKDEAKWFVLNDNSVINVQVRFPDGTLHPYNFGDTLQFIPAQRDAAHKENTAYAIFKPYFPVDGQYELIVSGKDMSQNTAGNLQYKVGFQVINKAMISNLLNYPNPFTTTTAFVFTLTGSEVPQNIKIEILTVTGKIVREITKEELGPLHIGTNITEFKWDGTDQYGQKLANGIYLYRVVTNLNGKSLDKYTSDNDNTDKYFTRGYGKMYLMR